jgi:hypothetical protein
VAAPPLWLGAEATGFRPRAHRLFAAHDSYSPAIDSIKAAAIIAVVLTHGCCAALRCSDAV